MFELPPVLSPETIKKTADKFEELLAGIEGDAGSGSGAIATDSDDGGGDWSDDFFEEVEKVCGELRAGGERWQIRSADLAALFSEIVRHGSFRGARVSDRAGNSAKAALEYLVEEFDVVPDYDPVLGFLDDAHVLIFAVDKLRDEDQDLYDLIEAALR